jgi:Outer membrane protein beta-barrel domain
MRKIYTLLAGLLITAGLMAQVTTDTTSAPKSDTIRVGGLIIIKKGKGKYETADSSVTIIRNRRKSENINTNWWIVDLGFANVDNKTNYTQAISQGILAPGMNGDNFKLRTSKSVNVNIWVFMQRLNLISHVVNLKYGVGVELNNYRFSDERIRFNKTSAPLVDLVNKPELSKNKLAADYLTVPLMLNFNFTPKKTRDRSFGFSVGASAGYLYSARQKIKGAGDGVKKTKSDFELEQFKLSYVGELHLGPVKLYGSMASKNMFNKGLDMTPYNLGIRLSNW